jgi:hypothetical protein
MMFCNCSDTITTRKNDEDDIKIGVEKNTKFYKYLKKMKLDSIELMFDLNSVKSKEVRSLLIQMHEGFGGLVSVQPLLVGSFVELRDKKIKKMEFNIVVNATYDKAIFKETMNLKLIEGKLLITSYHYQLQLN